MPFPKFLAVAFSVVCCWTLEAATPARWGLSANSGLFFNCSPGGGCTGNVRDVFAGTWRSYDSTLTSESTADYGTARVSVEMISRGSAFFPKISGVAESIGTNSHHNDGWGIAVEGYRYTGLAPATLEFNGTLSGESNGSRTSEGLTAEVYFFKDEGFVYYPHLPTLLGETSAQVITNFAMRIASTNSGAALSKKATISVQPGELIYIYAELMIGVNRQAGKTITVNGLQIDCPQSDYLVSESLLPITDLAIKKNGNAISLLMPPTRRPFAIQQSGLIFGGWDDSVLPVSSGDNGFFIIPVADDEAQRFFRVMLN